MSTDKIQAAIDAAEAAAEALDDVTERLAFACGEDGEHAPSAVGRRAAAALRTAVEGLREVGQPVAVPGCAPAGWVMRRNDDQSITITGSHGQAVVVHRVTIGPREIPEEVLHALAADMLAAAPPSPAQSSDHFPDATKMVAQSAGAKVYCCYGAFAEVGCVDDCPSKRATPASAPPAEPVNVSGPAELCPEPAPGLAFDAQGVLRPVEPAHPDDAAVDEFAALLKAKLAKARDKGRSGWRDPSWPAADINRQMHAHAAKGDPLDVAAYAMFLALRGEATTPAELVEPDAGAIHDAWQRLHEALRGHPGVQSLYRAALAAQSASGEAGTTRAKG